MPGINRIQITKIDDNVMFIRTPCIYIKQNRDKRVTEID